MTSKINSGVCQKQATKLIRLNKYKALFENTQLGSRVYAKLKRNIIQSKKSDQKVTFSKEKELLLKNIFGKSNQELSTKYPEIGLEKYAKDYYLQ